MYGDGGAARRGGGFGEGFGLGQGGAVGGGDEVDTLEGFTELGVGELVEGVEVGADGAGEEDGVLGDDGETGAQVM